MALLDHFQAIFTGADDYLIKDDGATGLAVFAGQPEDTAPRTTDYEKRLYTIRQITPAELPKYLPCTSLVNGTRYEAEAVMLAISFVTDTSVLALNQWMKYHLSVFNAAKEALLSADVAKAKATFANPLNGLTALITAMNADWASETPQTAPTDIIPGSNPAMSFMELSTRLEMWTLLEAYLNTPMPRTGLAPMQLLTKVN